MTHSAIIIPLCHAFYTFFSLHESVVLGWAWCVDANLESSVILNWFDGTVLVFSDNVLQPWRFYNAASYASPVICVSWLSSPVYPLSFKCFSFFFCGWLVLFALCGYLFCDCQIVHETFQLASGRILTC